MAIPPTVTNLLNPIFSDPPATNYPALPGSTTNFVDTIEGTAAAGTDPSLIDQTTEDLFPYNTATGANEISNSVPSSQWPTGFTPNPTPAEVAALPASTFEQWASQYQIEYVGNYLANNPGAPAPEVDIGPAGSQIHVVLSTPVPNQPQQVYIMDQLQLTDLAAMSTADQQLIASTQFYPTLAASLGLLNTDSTPSAATLYDVQTLFENTPIPSIPGSPLQPTLGAEGLNFGTMASQAADPFGITVAPTTIPPTATGPLKAPSGGTMTQADANVFNTELYDLYAQLKQAANTTSPPTPPTGAGIFNVSNIETQITAILTKFQNAYALGQIPLSTGPNPPQNPSGSNTYTNIDSLDNNAGINQGYQSIMQSERQILQVQQDNMTLTQTGTLGEQLDAPDLIAYFMLGMKQTSDAINVEQTQMVSQQNSLLACYTQMEQIVAQVLQSTNLQGSATNQTNLAGESIPPPAPQTGTSADLTQGTSGVQLTYTPQQLQLISMFNNPGTLNPIEALNSIARPTSNPQLIVTTVVPPATTPTYALSAMDSTQWNQFNTQLSDAVSQIQQTTQLATNNITTQQQEGDQEFALANNALSKALDLMQTIGQGFA